MAVLQKATLLCKLQCIWSDWKATYKDTIRHSTSVHTSLVDSASFQLNPSQRSQHLQLTMASLSKLATASRVSASSSATSISADLDPVRCSTLQQPKRHHIVAEVDHSGFGLPGRSLVVWNEELVDYEDPLPFAACSLNLLRAF